MNPSIHKTVQTEKTSFITSVSISGSDSLSLACPRRKEEAIDADATPILFPNDRTVEIRADARFILSFPAAVIISRVFGAVNMALKKPADPNPTQIAQTGH